MYRVFRVFRVGEVPNYLNYPNNPTAPSLDLEEESLSVGKTKKRSQNFCDLWLLEQFYDIVECCVEHQEEE